LFSVQQSPSLNYSNGMTEVR